MKEKIFKNFSLKIISAVFAVILWTIIVNIYDPNTGYTFSNVTVQLINTESLTNKGYVYEVLDGGKISVYVNGPKSVVTDLKASDIVATADLSKISAFADYVDIDVKVVKDGKVLTDVDASPKTTAVRLNIENRVTQSFNVDLDITGTPAEGYAVSGKTFSPTSIQITGASNIINAIDSVKGTCDVTGATANISGETAFVLYDEESNVIESTGIELSKDTMNYTISIDRTKTVPVKYEISGTPANGYAVLNTEQNLTTVAITGSSELVNKITEISIPAENLNINGISSDMIYTFDLSKYVGKGVTVVGNAQLKVTVKVTLAGQKTLTVNTGNINITGLGDAGTATISNPQDIVITVSGSPDVISSVTATDVTMTVNVKGLAQGTHSLEINFSVIGNCSVTGTYKVDVNVSKTQNSTEQTTSSDTQGTRQN